MIYDNICLAYKNAQKIYHNIPAIPVLLIRTEKRSHDDVDDDDERFHPNFPKITNHQFNLLARFANVIMYLVVHHHPELRPKPEIFWKKRKIKTKFENQEIHVCFAEEKVEDGKKR